MFQGLGWFRFAPRVEAPDSTTMASPDTPTNYPVVVGFRI